MAGAHNVGTTMMWHYKRQGYVITPQSHPSHPLLPFLDKWHETDCYQICVEKVCWGSCYDPLFDVVHVNEKWFFMTEETMHMYLTPDELLQRDKFLTSRT